MSLNPTQAAAILGRIPIRTILTTAVADAAAQIATAVRDELATEPGGLHEAPWRQSGVLQNSIVQTIDGLTAAIGSNDCAAAAQELGTAAVPPRPFLAPTAAALAQPIAHEIGAALASAISRAMA